MQEENVTIILTPIDVEMFKLFQKHYDLFKKLEDTEALNIAFGKCTIHFAFNIPQNIVKEEIVFRKEKE